MREIKFRAWDETTNEMFYELGDFYVSHKNNLRFGYDAGEEHPTVGHGDWVELILMQYTGLKDKNGQEIYEGDICKRYHLVGVVQFHNAMFILQDGFNEPLINEGYALEVIGNVYENPELL